MKENKRAKAIKILAKLYNFSESWSGTLIIVFVVILFFAQAFRIPSGSMKNTLLVGDFVFVKKFSYGIVIPHIPWLELPLLPDFNKNGHLLSMPGPKRGDIVVFRYPKDPKMHFVKRCVARSGDELIFHQKTLYVRMSEGDAYMREKYPNKLSKIGDKLFVREPFEKAGIHYDKRVDIDSIIFRYLAMKQFAMQPILIEGFKANKYGFNAYYFKVPKDEYFMMGDNRDHSSDSRFWGSVPYKYIVGKPWFVYFSMDENFAVRWDRTGRLVQSLEDNKLFIKHNPSDINALE